jgi:S1-C subfamily serine protease
VTIVDWIALAAIALLALAGLRRGLVVGVLSLAGLIGGAWLGSRIGPRLLAEDQTAWIPVAALVGAVLGGALIRSLAGVAGGVVRTSLLVVPPLRALDTAGGLLLGAATGLALCWIAAAAVLYLPGQTEARKYVQSSVILSAINERVPPEALIAAVSRVDPLGALAGPAAVTPAPDPAIAGTGAILAARRSVVRVTGTACGLGVEGSGWIAAPGIVVTNAHVVAGVDKPRVDRRGGRSRSATVVGFDRVNDLAVLRVPGLGGPPLRLGDPQNGAALALLGYPRNGPYRVAAVRLGETRSVISRDAYGNFPTPRVVVTLRGPIKPGNSGGPLVDSAGAVQAVVFAASTKGTGGYGIPAALVRKALDSAGAKALRTGCTSES